ncbi:MAG: OmpH family outer membrane protein [Deltaproteobacteria bacterium]|nr:MAG: OmpH family outer membrane protein [Deltaproteobacteria bacterium]
MKVLTLIMALLLPMTIWGASVVGKVDIQRVLVTIKEGKAVRDKLKKRFDEKQKIVKKEEAAIRKLQEDLKKQAMVLNDKAKAKKEKEIQMRFMKLQQQTMGFQKEIQSLENKYKKPILNKLRGIITEVSKKAGVDMTFESSTAPIVYAKNEKDLTDEIIKEYDKKFK